MVDLVFLAIMAVFILFRLYRVLGRKGGRSDFQMKNVTYELMQRLQKKEKDSLLPPSPKEASDRRFQGPQAQSQIMPPPPRKALDEEAQTYVTKIRRFDPVFDYHDFLSGACTAFGMILNAYTKGDIATLEPLLAPSVLKSFVRDIKNREKKGEIFETEVLRFIETKIISFTVRQGMLFVKVKFVTEQRCIPYPGKDSLIKEASFQTTFIERAEDEWTFSRNPKKSDPNWQLASTSGPG